MSTEPVSPPDRTSSTPRLDPGPVRLLGRDAELDVLTGLLGSDEPGVVNVTGALGSGKSALVQAAVTRVADTYGDVQRLDLSGETPETVLDRVRRYTAQLPIPLHRTAREAARSRTLVVLDRADALAPHGEELRALADDDGFLTLLVESVPAVRAPGCTALVVGPLPREDATLLLRQVAERNGVTLAHDPATEERLARLCSALDGNALAIELAGARLPLLPLANLEALVDDPRHALSVLTSPGALRRHRGIRTALAQAQEHSSAQSRQLLEVLSVFRGSFSLDAAEAVGGAVVAPVYDALGELVDLRLLEVDEPRGSGRYRLSRLVRVYAKERLEGSGLEELAHRRHASHLAHRARGAARAIEDADEDAARALLGEDYTEALEALRWLTSEDPVAALRLAADLGWEAHRRQDGEALVGPLEQLLPAVGGGHDGIRRDALVCLTQLQAWAPASHDRAGLIRSHVAEALDLARSLDEPLGLLRALRAQYVAAANLGDPASALAACVEGEQVASAIGHARWLGRFEVSRASIHSLLRQYEVAGDLAASGLARALRSGDRRSVVLAAMVLHGLPRDAVPATTDLPSLEALLGVTRDLGETQVETHVLAALTQDAVERGEPREAAAWCLARQQHLGRSQLLHGLTISAMLGVHVAHLRGDLRTSARLHGWCAPHVKPLFAVTAPGHAALYLAAVESVRERLGDEVFGVETRAGSLLTGQATLVELLAYLQGVLDSAEEPEPSTPPETEPDGRPPLTAREREVLTLLVRGESNKEIAGALFVSPKTVMHHTVAIYRKLGVSGRAEAATKAARLGLVPQG